MTTKRLSVSEFKARCTEEIRAVETGDVLIEITRHGKKVAVVCSPAADGLPTDLASWLGSGKGTVVFGQDYDPHAPAWSEDDWES
ncbi:MAG: type II toxin-antitoxin system Phd/YefM family antitoxin [Planctomycetaceae bacterium]|nr:type II toxin-antitoxin system Phd/YefM family antitoxin [Planctomycetaceae bacterium]